MGADRFRNTGDFLVGGSHDQDGAALTVAIDVVQRGGVGLNDGRRAFVERNLVNGAYFIELFEAAGGIAA